MVNRDFVCVIWFGFIKWKTTKDMMEGKKRDRMCQPTYLMCETQDISSGASPSALEHDCGRRNTAAIVVSGLLTSLLYWLRYCCEKS